LQDRVGVLLQYLGEQCVNRRQGINPGVSVWHGGFSLIRER
jgi:hypothetical protein